VKVLEWLIDCQHENVHHRGSKGNRKQVGQCTFNITFRGFRATINVVEQQWVLRIVSVCL